MERLAETSLSPCAMALDPDRDFVSVTQKTKRISVVQLQVVILGHYTQFISVSSIFK